MSGEAESWHCLAWGGEDSGEVLPMGINTRWKGGGKEEEARLFSVLPTDGMKRRAHIIKDDVDPVHSSKEQTGSGFILVLGRSGKKE